MAGLTEPIRNRLRSKSWESAAYFRLLLKATLCNRTTKKPPRFRWGGYLFF
jgi:hypothetical protein